MKSLVLYILMIELLSARAEITITGGHGGYFGVLNRKPNITATLDFNYDDTYSDNNSIVVNNSNFKTMVYQITAEADEVILVNFDKTVDFTNGTDTVQVDNIACDKGGEFTMPSNGEAELRIQGTVNLPDNVSFGNYTGNINLTLDYKDPE